jgi:NitT/TauT family transport system substrate-binding protein
MAAHVGIDPSRDLNWVTSEKPVATGLFTSGKVDAFLGFPPDPQEMRAQKIGHVIVNSSVDRPWSQYFCCVLAGNREFVRKHPVATKAVLSAILKAADLCVTEPARAAQRLVDVGFTPRYDHALQNAERGFLRQMARVRPRGYNSILCAAPARSRLHQVEPAEDYCRRHRLALLERA